MYEYSSSTHSSRIHTSKLHVNLVLHARPVVLRAGGLELFREFLRIEFSEENLEFWLACERYRLLFDAGDQQQPSQPTQPQPHQSQTQSQTQAHSQTTQIRRQDSGGVSADTLNALLEDTALSSCSDAQNMKQLIFDTYLAPLSSREARTNNTEQLYGYIRKHIRNTRSARRLDLLIV